MPLVILELIKEEDANKMMTKEQAREFASKWLPAWTGNDPEKLADFYSDDVLYLDPGIPKGVRGKNELLSYLRKLLSQNPNWVWTQIGPKVIECIGVCLVQFNSQGLIRRNEVYFDRTELVSEIYKCRQSQK